MPWPQLTEAAVGGALIRFTGRGEGDLGHGGTYVEVEAVLPDVMARRAAVLDVPWSWVRQVHGNGVVIVDRPGGGAMFKLTFRPISMPDGQPQTPPPQFDNRAAA